jgi:SAM-dependent methyltransferase
MSGGELYNEQREYFLSFLARTTQKDKTIEHLLEHLPSSSPQTARAIEQGKQVRFLDIGPGIGRISIPFIDRLGRTIDYTAREPNIGVVVNFFLDYLYKDLPCQRLIIDPRESVDYGREEFDFVLASHMFYYLSDWNKALQTVCDSLVPGGAACIIMGSEDSELVKFRREFFPVLHGTTPKTAEELEAVLEKTKFSYETQIIESHIDLAPEIGEHYRHIREEGIYEPSLEALFSFILRTDFTNLAPEMQERVRKYLNRRHLNLTDKAIWLKKPGVYDKRQDAGENPPQKLTIESFLQTFEPMLETHLGDDVAFLSPALKEAYFSILALDCVLTHPVSCLMIYDEKQNVILTDDYFDPIHPKKGKQIKDFVLFDSSRLPFSHKDNSPDEDQNYFMRYVLGTDRQTFLFHYINQEYTFLPEEDRRDISKREFFRLILNIFDRFKHNQVFSNRYDGSTLIGLYLMSPYLAREKLRTPEEVTPKLAEYYKGLGISI